MLNRAESVHYSVEHTPEAQARDRTLVASIHALATPVSIKAHEAQLLYAPSAVTLSGGFHGGHWGTLMPFLRACEKSGLVPRCLPIPSKNSFVAPHEWPLSCSLDGLQLAVMPKKTKQTSVTGTSSDDEKAEVVDWGAPIRAMWAAGEENAIEACDRFVATGMHRYERDRSRTDLLTPSFLPASSPPPHPVSTATSRLSVALRFGELSPRYLYWAINDAGLPKEITKTFARRLHWRDLAYFHLSRFPDMRLHGIRRHYDTTRWISDEDEGEYLRRLRSWQRGRTGYPLVDAGMRELYATGWMAQSVRMVCASFLVEYLRASWTDGQAWFAETLCDADSAINAMMWQNAGRCGIDQWNFVMSPENASQDPSGRYTRHYVPELAELPTKYLHRPWQAPPEVLRKANVDLGSTYPHRVVTDLVGERRRSVEAVLEMRRANQIHNDGKGYDIIEIPSSPSSASSSFFTSRVFTKEEYRIGRSGEVLPPPPRNRKKTGGGGGGGGRNRKSKENSAKGKRTTEQGQRQYQEEEAKKRGEEHGTDSANKSPMKLQQGKGSQRRVTDFFKSGGL